LAPGPDPQNGAASRWYELSLAGAAAVAGVAGTFAPKLIAALGGFQQWPVGSDYRSRPAAARVLGDPAGFLELFGANIASTGNYGTESRHRGRLLAGAGT